MARTVHRRRAVRARGVEYKRRPKRRHRRRHQEAHGPRRARGQWAERWAAEANE